MKKRLRNRRKYVLCGGLFCILGGLGVFVWGVYTGWNNIGESAGSLIAIMGGLLFACYAGGKLLSTFKSSRDN